jgi:hypothetical protein
MQHHSTNSSGHDYDTFSNARVSKRMAFKIASDVNWLLLQDNAEIFGESFNTNLISQELEQQYRQRWRIE